MAAMLACFASWDVVELGCGRIANADQAARHMGMRMKGMPMKPLDITEMDIQRARRIERSWAPKDLSEGQAEYVVRAIAQGIAQGRQQGLELAKALND